MVPVLGDDAAKAGAHVGGDRTVVEQVAGLSDDFVPVGDIEARDPDFLGRGFLKGDALVEFDAAFVGAEAVWRGAGVEVRS